MDNYTTFSARGSLMIVGLLMRRWGIWAKVKEMVCIKQKTVKDTPVQKLLDAFINILAGGEGIVEINTRLKPDRVLQRAFGRTRCADQSQVSTTLNRCGPDNVKELREANDKNYHIHGRSYRHDYDRDWQLLDVDTSGMPSGKKGEKSTKGYISRKKGRRGRQLGRVLATLYDEIIVDRLYSGKVQLEKSFQELVEMAEKVMDLGLEKRRHTILRVDAGAGTDKHINWALGRSYELLTKVKNWKRTQKLTQSIEQWTIDPKFPGRQFAWVPEPHSYVRATRQLATRCQGKNGKWKVRVLVTTLSNTLLCSLAGIPFRKDLSETEIALALLYAYDLRSGGAETSIKDSKHGLGITKRNKRNFHAQEMLVLLAQLASNLIAWMRHKMTQHVPSWRQFGRLRMVRDVFHITAIVKLDAQGRILTISLNKAHEYAAKFLAGIAPALAGNDLTLNLRQI